MECTSERVTTVGVTKFDPGSKSHKSWDKLQFATQSIPCLKLCRIMNIFQVYEIELHVPREYRILLCPSVIIRTVTQAIYSTAATLITTSNSMLQVR